MALTAHRDLVRRFKKRADLYFHSPSGHSWPVIGRNLPLLYLIIIIAVVVVALLTLLLIV